MQLTSELYKKTTLLHWRLEIDITAEGLHSSFSNKPFSGAYLLVLVFSKDDIVY